MSRAAPSLATGLRGATGPRRAVTTAALMGYLRRRNAVPGARQHRLVMGDGHDRGTVVAKAGDDRHQLGPRGGVLPERRLIEHHHARSRREHGGDGQPPLLPAGQRVGVGFGERTEPQALQQLVDAHRDLLRGQSQGPWADFELRSHSGGEQLMLRILEDCADSGQQRPRRPRDRGGLRARRQRSGCRHPARLGGDETGQSESQRGLAGAVRPDHPERLRGADLEVERTGDRDAAHPRHRERLGAQEGLGRGRARRRRERGRDAGNPHSAGGERRASIAQHRLG